MSTLPQQETINQYLGDGATVTFNYNFLVLENADMTVYVTAPGNSANPNVDFIPQSQYSITGVGNVTGGTITFLVAPAMNAIVTILRNMQLSISTAFSNAQNFNGANLDAAFQRVTLMIQQMQGNAEVTGNPVNPNVVNGAITRCLQYVINTFLPDTEQTILPSLFELNGVPTDGLVWVSQGSGIAATQLFTGGDANALKILLASETMGAPGAALVGYYDTVNNVPQTVDTFLQNLPTFLQNLHFPTAANLQSGYAVGANDTGAVNALVVTLSPALAAYVAYNRLWVKAANTNSGASTININGLGAKNITFMDGSALTAGAIQAGAILELVYDGTEYQLMNPIIRTATASETFTGTDAIHAINPAGLKAAFGVGSGTVALPGGLILKWGTSGVAGANSSVTFTFGAPFPNSILLALATPSNNSTTNVLTASMNSPLALDHVIINNPSATTATSYQVFALGT